MVPEARGGPSELVRRAPGAGLEAGAVSIVDRSVELAHDRYQAAQRAFLATPCRRTGDSYRERFAVFYRRFNRSSVGLDEELARLDRTIERVMAESAGGEQ